MAKKTVAVQKITSQELEREAANREGEAKRERKKRPVRPMLRNKNDTGRA
jgi:hypothetical protein